MTDCGFGSIGRLGMSKKHVMMAGAVMLAASAVALAGPAGGTISGKVASEGAPAKMKPIDMSKKPSCAKKYTTPPAAETVVAGTGDSLGGGGVYIFAGGGARYRPRPTGR